MYYHVIILNLHKNLPDQERVDAFASHVDPDASYAFVVGSFWTLGWFWVSFTEYFKIKITDTAPK